MRRWRPRPRPSARWLPTSTSSIHRPRRCRTALPDGAAYQQIMGVFEHERRPLRARDLCLALDLAVMPKHVEGTRAKLKRLVSLGFLDETEPGLFQQPRPPTPPSPADQRP